MQIAFRYLSLILLTIALMSCKDNDGRSSPIGSSSSSVSNFSSAANSNVSSSTSTEQLAKKIDAYLASNQSSNLPGVSVIVVKDGKLAYSGGKGMADIPSGIAIASNTGFRLASVSKPFTAIAIMQLVERGELKVTDSILDYIPELSPDWRRITIEHLLTHSSGIYDIINDGWRPNLLNGMTHAKLINFLIDNPTLEFEPGTQFDYSNTGYMLLASIIERKTGLTFSEHMQRNIFEPANMHGSYINDENQAIKYGDALNYASSRTYYGITTYLKGSMAQVSSRDDFFNFFAAMRDKKLISAATFADMSRTRGVLIGGAPYGYGFATFGDFVGHMGEWDGFETEIYMSKTSGIEFAILTNSGSVGRENSNAIKNIILTSSF